MNIKCIKRVTSEGVLAMTLDLDLHLKKQMNISSFSTDRAWKQLPQHKGRTTMADVKEGARAHWAKTNVSATHSQSNTPCSAAGGSDILFVFSGTVNMLNETRFHGGRNENIVIQYLKRAVGFWIQPIKHIFNSLKYLFLPFRPDLVYTILSLFFHVGINP